MDRGRCLLAVTAVALALALWGRSPATGDDELPWIVEPGPEKPESLKAGAAELEVALGFAKKKLYADAVKALETVARRWPAALHDCNLSLAYLRAGALTRAQLMWDVAGLRNAARPNWCTGDLSTQLSTALRAAGYVPVSLDVTPAEAVIELGGARVRGIRVLWLPPGAATISARATGKLSATKPFDVTAPSTRVQLDLADPPPVAVDAGVEPAPIDAPAPPPDVPIVEQPARESHTLRYAAGGTAAVGLIGGATFYFLARSARSDANAVFPNEPGFDDAKSSFETRRVVAYSLLAVGAIAAAYFTYDVVKQPKKRVSIEPVSKGAALTIGGEW